MTPQLVLVTIQILRQSFYELPVRQEITAWRDRSGPDFRDPGEGEDLDAQGLTVYEYMEPKLMPRAGADLAFLGA